MSPDLKKCPSCGEPTSAEEGPSFLIEKRDWPYSAACSCGLTLGFFETKQAAADAWNALPRRDDPKPAAPGMADGELIARAIRAHAMMVGRDEYAFHPVDAELSRREQARAPHTAKPDPEPKETCATLADRLGMWSLRDATTIAKILRRLDELMRLEPYKRNAVILCNDLDAILRGDRHD